MEESLQKKMNPQSGFSLLLGGSVCLLAGLRKNIWMEGWKDERSAKEDWTDLRFEACKEDDEDCYFQCDCNRATVLQPLDSLFG